MRSFRFIDLVPPELPIQHRIGLASFGERLHEVLVPRLRTLLQLPDNEPLVPIFMPGDGSRFGDGWWWMKPGHAFSFRAYHSPPTTISTIHLCLTGFTFKEDARKLLQEVQSELEKQGIKCGLTQVSGILIINPWEHLRLIHSSSAN